MLAVPVMNQANHVALTVFGRDLDGVDHHAPTKLGWLTRMARPRLVIAAALAVPCSPGSAFVTGQSTLASYRIERLRTDIRLPAAEPLTGERQSAQA